jgi:hypothetical protein
MSQYSLYRHTNKEINHKIMDSSLNRQTFLKAAKLLGMIRGENVSLEFDEDLIYVTDFAINDIRIKGETAATSYQKNIGGESTLEKKILAALVLSYTSLFRVKKIDNKKHTIALYDILNDSEIEITDYNLSKTIPKDVLLFCRVLQFDDLSMTSGVCFVFPSILEKYLLIEYEANKKKMKRQPDNIIRFVSFFKLDHTNGVNISYISPF